MVKETNKKTTTKKREKVVKENNKKTKSKDTKKIKKETDKKEEQIKNIEEEYEEYDYDLEDFLNEDEEEEKIVIKKDKTNKEEKEKRKEEKEKKKEEKRLLKEEKEKNKKEVKVKNKNTGKEINKKLIELGKFIEKNRLIIIAFALGVLVSVIAAMLLWPERIATLKNGEEPVVKVGKNTYTADNLYTRMKEYYNVSQLLNQIDSDLLTELYPEDKEMTKEVKENAEYYINMYKEYYGYTEEQFLSSNGFNNYNEFIEYLKIDNRRKKYLDDYVKKNLSDKEIETYYNKNVYGDINCQHILVETAEDSKDKLKDEDGKKLAEEIIGKINDGTSWDDIKKEYKDKITFEDLGYQSWDSDLEDSFKTALKELDDNSFSKVPVKTSYGYHIIYRLDQKEAPTLKKAKKKIVSNLVSEKKAADQNLQYKALISLYNENKIKFYDTDMEAKYDTYKKQYK